VDSEESEARAGNDREKTFNALAHTVDQSGQRSHGFTRMIGLVLNPLRSIKRIEKENTKRNAYFFAFPSSVALYNTSAKQQQR
jgi:hypothetical protein